MPRENPRKAIAWFGVLLMLASFIWWQLLPTRSPRRMTSSPSLAGAGSFNFVVLDPGHGGQDSGAIREGILEKDLSLDVARRVARFVQAQGLTSLLTRGEDNYVSLSGRAEIANKQRGAIFVSIHFDEAGRAAATGVETYYAVHQISSTPSVVSWLPFLKRTSFETTNTESQSLAAFIQQSLVTHTKALNRGTRAEQFFVIANVRHPAVLVEGGFLTNKEDVSKLTSDAYREELAAAICEGIMRYRQVVPRPGA